MSLPVRGAWIEINYWDSTRKKVAMSLPVRGAWIEIANAMFSQIIAVRRSPCGERGLKSPDKNVLWCWRCRSPCGERGLKCVRCVAASKTILSLPVRGAWIEMVFLQVGGGGRIRRSPCGERGLK